MKNVAVAIMIGLSFMMVTVYAAPLHSTGTIKTLRSHDSSWRSDIDWFSLEGVSSLGSCKTFGGQVVFRLKDDERGARQYSLILAAKMASKSITAFTDDTYLDSDGWCLVKTVELQ